MGQDRGKTFALGSLGWTTSRNVYVIYVGQDIQALTHQLAAALAHVSQLEEQLAQQPAPPTATPPVDPMATEALAALMELAKALTRVRADA